MHDGPGCWILSHLMPCYEPWYSFFWQADGLLHPYIMINYIYLIPILAGVLIAVAKITKRFNLQH